MAGLYCDITLLAKVGKETATNTISRQAILYSSSGLMFSAQTTAFFRYGICDNAGFVYLLKGFHLIVPDGFIHTHSQNKQRKEGRDIEIWRETERPNN